MNNLHEITLSGDSTQYLLDIITIAFATIVVMGLCSCSLNQREVDKYKSEQIELGKLVITEAEYNEQSIGGQ